ncbi:MAG: TolC family protein [Paludibacteraceae bacterium]|nr:TolC family protein [Paludibacteraceae bacterium]
MKKLFIMLAILPVMSMAQTLEECQHAAERNCPLIRQYDLINQTTDLTVSNISKGWLPQVSASAQATYQSDVVSWPDRMQMLYQQMGLDMKGLKKDQYKMGMDINQTVYDGGVIKGKKEMARKQGEVDAAQTEVTLYQVRKRVNEMYFGLLLLDEQIRLNADLQELLSANEKKISSMYKQGTAAESDYNAVKAERLKVMQQAVDLQSQKRSLKLALSAFCGIEVESVQKPALVEVAQNGLRPELKMVDAQMRLADTQEKLLNATLMPKLSVFASGFYGYPGYNMFEDMLRHEWSLNGIVVAKLTWNIGAFYTRKNDKANVQLQREMFDVNREMFLFYNNIEQIQQREEIARYQALMTTDEEIISLRSSVRKAAESKLSHGVIDVNDLVKEINNENAARVQQSIHEIEMLKEIYNLKYTTNN